MNLRSTSRETLIDLEFALFHTPLESLRDKLSYDSRLSKLFAVFETRCSEPNLNLHAISRACGMSRNNLNTVLKRMTGLTCCRLLRAFRIHRSVLLSLRSNESFTTISSNCGFQDSSSYSKAVHGHLGVSPRDLLPKNSEGIRHLRMPQRVSWYRNVSARQIA